MDIPTRCHQRFRTLVASAVAALTVCAASTLSAQNTSRPFTSGARNLSLGYMTGEDYEGSGIGLMVERGVLAFSPQLVLGLGGFTGVSRNTTRVGTVDVRATTVPVMGVLNLHLSPAGVPKVDLYTGLSAGFTRVSRNVIALPVGSPDSDGTEFSLGIQGGGRYALTTRASILAQVALGDLPLILLGGSYTFR
jgi:hypothetical protein